MGGPRQPPARAQREEDVFGSDYKVLAEFELPVCRETFITLLWGDLHGAHLAQQHIRGGSGGSGGGGIGVVAGLNGVSGVNGHSNGHLENGLEGKGDGGGGGGADAALKGAFGEEHSCEVGGGGGGGGSGSTTSTTSTFYYEYLAEGLKDLEVDVGHWHVDPGGTRTRKVQSLHPTKVSFPGMASHAPCTKTQTYRFVTVALGQEETVALVIEEQLKVSGIPYEDYFSVRTKWLVKQRPPVRGGGGGGGGDVMVHAKVGLLLTFHKSTWLKGAITSNTTEELKQSVSTWKSMALKWIDKAASAAAAASVLSSPSLNPTLLAAPSPSSRTHTPSSRGGGGGGGGAAVGDIEMTGAVRPPRSRLGSKEATGVIGVSSATASPIRNGVDAAAAGGGTREWSNLALTDEDDGDVDIENGDELFFDCVTYELSSPSHAHERTGFLNERGTRSNSSSGGGWAGSLHRRGTRDHDLEADGHGSGQRDADGRLLSGRSHSVRTNVANRVSAFFFSNHSGAPLLEVAVVMMEYVYLQIRSAFESSVLRVLFDIEQEEAFRRLCCSLVPGMHGNLARKPDLYVPVMLALTLAQVFLFCMDVTQHHCRRETALGTSMAVAFGTWVGTSAFYYLLAFLMASRLRMVQSLAVTGYGLFGWCMGLMVCHAMTDARFNFGDEFAGINDVNVVVAGDGNAGGAADGTDAADNDVLSPRGGLFNGLFNISAEVPLAFFGILSGAAMGAVFWQQTPARRGCSLLLYLPKVVCFLLVLGTHYQFLRYLHHQFLPGNQRLCAITSMLHPKDYYNIVTQKELRQFVGARQ